MKKCDQNHRLFYYLPSKILQSVKLVGHAVFRKLLITLLEVQADVSYAVNKPN